MNSIVFTIEPGDIEKARAAFAKLAEKETGGEKDWEARAMCCPVHFALERTGYPGVPIKFLTDASDVMIVNGKLYDAGEIAHVLSLADENMFDELAEHVAGAEFYLYPLEVSHESL